MARALCLRKLTARPCTRYELADLLAKRGIAKAAAESVLDRFVEVGLIDDAGLAASYAVARHEEQGMARAAIATRLRRRGVRADVVRSAVEQIDPASEEAAARELVLKRLPGMARLDDATKARRLVGQLARKGYPAGLCYRVVREVVAEVELPVD
ncbi:MAG: regulatory protein RecX [Jatrophihabitans sp.]